MTNSDKVEWGKKYHSAYFLNGSIFNVLFHCHIISYWDKMTSDEKFSHNA